MTINVRYTMNKARALRFAPHAAKWAVDHLNGARMVLNADGTYLVFVADMMVFDIWERH